MSIGKHLLRMTGLVCVMLCCITGPVLAQNATLSGTVSDADTGDPLPGANVVVTSGTAQTGAAATSDGTFSVANIRPGTYAVKVTFIGYQTYSMADVVLSAGETKTLNVTLEVTGIELNPISISASRRAEKALDAPASISVIELREINQMVAPSSASLLQNVTGVDMATTGVDRREIVMRGFSNAFSGAAYVLTDNRRAAVPSLDVNLHSIMPNLAIDLDKVEIVRGPGSALYGSGVDAGVVHYITKDPFTHPGTTVSFSGGERTSLAGHLRHAGVLGESVGYKVTAQYAQADDWGYSAKDSLDLVQINKLAGVGLSSYNRDYEKLNVNGLLEFKLGDDTKLIANGGYSTLTSTVLSGIGTVQADGYGYTYGQLRFQSGNFFAQTYLNKNDAGDSFVYGQLKADEAGATSVVDKSYLFNAQAQYDMELANGKEHLVFGVDYERTSPDTEGSIFGRNEDDDLIEETGAYVQSTTNLTEQLDFTAALRADYNNIEEDFQFSPRAAIVFKPTPQHSLRATYNRAYSLPGGNSLHLDIVGLRLPISTSGFDIVQRGMGSRNGFTFNTARSQGGITASSMLPVPGVFGGNFMTYSAPGVPTQNVPLAAVYGMLYAGLSATPNADLVAVLGANGIPVDEATVAALKVLLRPQGIDPNNPLPATNVQGLGTSILAAAPEDVDPLKSTITQSFEVGYKGLVTDRLLFAVDFYKTQKKNFVSGVTQISPLAGYQMPDGSIPIVGELTPALAAAIAANPALAPTLQQLGVAPELVAGLIVGLGAADLNALFSQVPAGVVQPDQNTAAGEIVGGYRNFGDVDFWGIDASVQFLASSRLNLFGNISIVSDDFFDNDELGVENTAIFQALNASKFKAKGGFSYNIPRGLNVNVAGRYTKAYPVASGPYIGGLPISHPDDIGGLDNYFVLDLGAGYDLNAFAPGLRFDVTVQNVLNNEHREFIGAPQIGRLALARLTFTR